MVGVPFADPDAAYVSSGTWSLIGLETTEPVVSQGAMTAKAAMQLLGVLPNRNVRLPLVPADDALVAHLRDVLTRSGLLGRTT